MTKRIRTALAALAIAFAIAFSAHQLAGFTGMISDTAGGIKVTAGVKPPKGAPLAVGVTTAPQAIVKSPGTGSY
jgi:hypothetical protein